MGFAVFSVTHFDNTRGLGKRFPDDVHRICDSSRQRLPHRSFGMPTWTTALRWDGDSFAAVENLDRSLGQDDGLELVTELRQRYEPHRVFLMLLTSRDSERDKLEGMSLGADLYLSKKVSDEHLLANLEQARDAVRLRSK